MNLLALGQALRDRGEKPYRLEQAKQIYYVSLGTSWEDVTAWPKQLREDMAKVVPWDTLVCDRVEEGVEGDTMKFLLVCTDGAKIEMVIMRHEEGNGRNTVCISSQVGCPMACAFCATGKMGFTRNLTSNEIAEQVVIAARWLKERDAKVGNVVYMGMGEPMHNYDEVMNSVRLLNDPKALALGVRHISISTCGIVPGILKLADDPLRVNLAISLHAATDDVRSKLMPVNKAYPIKKLMAAVDTYLEKTNRKVLLEYLMIEGINDHKEDAKALVRLVRHKKHLYHVNVIKYHDTGVFKHTKEAGRAQFVQWLREEGIPVTHRRTFGEDIDAACGQLATESKRKV
jgi:23S rRNA (adenine2503-C2)-methyltransferase